MSAVTDAAREPVRGRSREAARLFSDLMVAPIPARRRFLAGLSPMDLRQVLAIADREGGTPYALWRDDPIGFIECVLGEAMWSKPREILTAVMERRHVAVPSAFDTGKTWSAARAVLHFAFTNPVGSAKVVTIAPLWRQVVRQLWPEIRRAHSRARLPGTMDTAQLKLVSSEGLETVVAYGLSAAPWNEASVQGIHAGRLLLVVDEAGGISPIIGRNLRAMLVGEETHLLAIGNPPTDDQGAWFERLCQLDSVTTIPIAAADTPNLSGEDTPLCRSCPTAEAPHNVASHLVDRQWVNDTIAEHGEDSPYVAAKVYAKFPRGGPSQALPAAWVDAAAETEEPDDELMPVLAEMNLLEETDPWRVKLGSWVRLGVDVASDGGDEFVISRCVGDLVTIQHIASGVANTNPTDVAGVVLKEILRAQALRNALGTSAPVRVKLDAIGVGWGVAGVLAAWRSEELHEADIVPVVVSEKTEREPDAETLRPYRKRDEMWLATRSLLQPRGEVGRGVLRLRLDRRTLGQLRGPAMGTNASGYTTIEGKKSLRDRGLPSPDRAEAVLLCLYEPGPVRKKRKKAKVISV